MTANSDILDINDYSGFETDSNDYIIKVIGVGGGGCNAVNYMYEQQIPYVNFVVVNTDRMSLQQSPVPQKMLIGDRVTGGQGAGNKPEVGKECANSDTEKINTLFSDQTEMVFITAGMGGGTGTGAAPVVAKLAKEAGMLTIGIVTIPFLFEGEKKILKSIEGANEMKKYVDALLVINNENLVNLYSDLTFFNAFNKADDTLANAARSISEIISETLYINVDFRDVHTTLKDSGTAIIATAEGEGEHRVTNAINNAIHSPLLKAHDIYSSKRLLLKFMCWKDAPNALGTKEINEITAFTSRLPKNIEVKWGIGDDPSLGDKVKVTILASGFDLTLNDEMKIPGDDQNTDNDEGLDKRESTDEQIRRMYGREKIQEHMDQQDRARYAVLKPEQFDDYEVIQLLEKVPTFNRKGSFKETLEKMSKVNSEVHKQSKPAFDSDNAAVDMDSGAQTIFF